MWFSPKTPDMQTGILYTHVRSTEVCILIFVYTTWFPLCREICVAICCSSLLVFIAAESDVNMSQRHFSVFLLLLVAEVVSSAFTSNMLVWLLQHMGGILCSWRGSGLAGLDGEDVPEFTTGLFVLQGKEGPLVSCRGLARCDFASGAEHLLISCSGFMSFSYFSFGGIVSFFRSFDPFAIGYKG